MEKSRRKHIGVAIAGSGACLLALLVVMPALGFGPLYATPAPSSAVIQLKTTLSVGKSPDGFVYNPDNNQLYVANEGASSVYAFNASTDALLFTISVKSHPGPLAYDPANGEVYVADYGASYVSIIPPTDAAPTSIKVGATPNALLYDPANKEMLVSVWGTSDVAALNSTTNAVKQIAGFNEPDAMTFDNATNTVFVQNYNNNSVAEIGKTNKIVEWIGVDYTCNYGTDFPNMILYDPANKTVWSAACGSNVVDILNKTSYVRYLDVPGGAESLAYDPANSEMYLTDNSGQVTFFNSKTYATTNVSVDATPRNLVYDPSNQLVYVTSEGENSVTAVNVTSVNIQLTIVGVGSEPDAIFYNSVQGTIWVGDYGTNTVSIVTS